MTLVLSESIPMKNLFAVVAINPAVGNRCPFWAYILVLVLTLAGMQARAADGEMSKETQACLKCHDKPGEVKKLENGEILSMHISTQAFVESMHKETDCEDCHSDLDEKTHGKVKTPIDSKRAYTLGKLESCRECHKKNFKAYEDGLHAALVKEGSKANRKDAPVCSNCHNSHTLRSVKIVTPISDTPCASCHEDIFKAYSKDVHGLERIAKGKAAPICADCHKAHEIKAASLGDGIKDACIACHKEAVSQHKEWLPNAERHFDAISCPVCHAPEAQRRVNLRLYDKAAKQQVSEKSGVPQFEKRAQAVDSGNAGLDERALWSMLNEFNQPGVPGNTVLRGRLEVQSGIEAHQISEKSKAIKDCDTCHKVGAEAFQSVTLTVAGPDGRPLRHGVNKDVLTSLTATQSISGFYAIGSTRIKLLDYLLVLVVLGAMSVPMGHMAVRRLFKSVRERLEAERLAVAAQATDSVAPSPTNAAQPPVEK